MVVSLGVLAIYQHAHDGAPFHAKAQYQRKGRHSDSRRIAPPLTVARQLRTRTGFPVVAPSRLGVPLRVIFYSYTV